MKRLFPVLICLCLLMTGCGKKDVQAGFESFSAGLNSAQTISFTANIRAEYENKTARFTLAYEQTQDGGSVTVLAPELIKGITARISPGSTLLEYDTVVLDTGTLDSFGLSPMSSLPLMMQALKCAHIDSFWDEGDLQVLQLEPEDGLKCTVWFDESLTIPLRAEIISGGRVTVYIEISDWNTL